MQKKPILSRAGARVSQKEAQPRQMKNIYFVQACDVHGSGSNATAYLPYATGLLAAYAFHSETVKQNYRVKRFIYKKENIAEAIASLEAPAAVGFSTYIWNFEYNIAFAAALKKAYPECAVIFGGHNVSNCSASQLDIYPFIDFLVHGEGEIAFCGILEHLCTDRRFSEIPNISYRGADGKAVRTKEEPICTLDYPSPYLEGWFEDILKNDNMIFSALLETNRGCPYRCAYCDWGSITLRMRQFPIERVIAEMEYFAAHKIQFCFCIDSNFGMFKRDFEIVDAFLEIKKRTGYPEMFKCCTTEGSGMAEFNINKKLNDSQILKGASLALQTLSEEALENIGRKNMSIARYADLTARYNEAGIPTYSELIYGLPGETYESFAENLSFMLQSGTTKGCFIHYCELLPNAALAKPENVEKFKIKTAKIPYTQFHSTPEPEIREYSNIIVSTYSMDYDAWIRACTFGLFVQCFHYMGVLQCFSRYLYYEEKVPYKTFYEKLIAWAEHRPDTLLGAFYAEIREKLGGLKRGETISRVHVNPAFGNIDWPLEEGMCLEIVTHADRFFDEIRDFLLGFGLAPALGKELLSYQFNILRKPEPGTVQAEYSVDLLRYFREIDLGAYEAPQHVKNTLTFDNRMAFSSLEDYAMKVVWFGRKSARILLRGDELKQTFGAAPEPDADV